MEIPGSPHFMYNHFINKIRGTITTISMFHLKRVERIVEMIVCVATTEVPNASPSGEYKGSWVGFEAQFRIPFLFSNIRLNGWRTFTKQFSKNEEAENIFK